VKRAVRRSRHRNVRTFRIAELAHGDKLDARFGEWGAILCLHLPADKHFGCA